MSREEREECNDLMYCMSTDSPDSFFISMTTGAIDTLLPNQQRSSTCLSQQFQQQQIQPL